MHLIAWNPKEFCMNLVKTAGTLIRKSTGWLGGVKEFVRNASGGFDVSRLVVLLVFGIIVADIESSTFNLRATHVILMGVVMIFTVGYKYVENRKDKSNGKV